MTSRQGKRYTKQFSCIPQFQAKFEHIGLEILAYISSYIHVSLFFATLNGTIATE